MHTWPVKWVAYLLEEGFGADRATFILRSTQTSICSWVVVNIKVPFWVPIIIRHLSFRVPQKGP